MPDALSKTVPIWCVVLNRLLFEDRPDSHELRVPEDAVGASERSQIESRIDGLVNDAKVRNLAQF